MTEQHQNGSEVPVATSQQTASGKGVPTETNPWSEKVEVEALPRWQRWLWKAATWGRVEIRGISPIPVEERTIKRTINIFTLWFGMSANILA